jgi:hypothetical protein
MVTVAAETVGIALVIALESANKGAARTAAPSAASVRFFI